MTQDLVISFQAPENIQVIVENDPAVSKQVNVTVTADFAVTLRFTLVSRGLLIRSG